MINAYCVRDGSLSRITVQPDAPIPADAVWIDLLRPEDGEDSRIEAVLGVSIPTREEMVEIEPSSRLRIENGARYMTGAVVSNSESEKPGLSAVTFILAGGRLATVRYDETKPFALTAANLDKSCPATLRGSEMLLLLLDAIIDRAADIIERLAEEIDALSAQIFEDDEPKVGSTQHFRMLIAKIGRRTDLASKVRESLVSMARVVIFLANEGEVDRFTKDQRALLKSMQRDIASLSDHINFLGNKVTFLLDATLGMVSIEQNNIIKIFAVLSVVLMPPTLIASIYGMNFQHMPELSERLGYPLALLAMLAAAVLPYMLFKWKRWL